MTSEKQYLCEQLVRNKEAVKKVFKWESDTIQLCCAGIFLGKRMDIDPDILARCKSLVKEKTGIFSNFRSVGEAPVAAMMAAGADPELTLENGLKIYDLLKKEFRTSSYLPFVAMMIADMVQASEYEKIIARTRHIYDLMKKEHPFLTSEEDSAFCSLLALSEKADEELIADMEACFQVLKPHFFSNNAVQSLSHVLALSDRQPGEKCDRTMELFRKLKDSRHKYGTDHELASLGVLAISECGIDEMVNSIIEIDEWLSRQKGFGALGAGKAQRLMYAGMITGNEIINLMAAKAAAVNSAVGIVIAQQVAVCCAVSACTSASAIASASSH